jgi:guanine deaminase
MSYNINMTEVEIMKQLIVFARIQIDKNNAYPFAAFVVNKGEIISKGYNNKVNLFGDKTTHGEMEALSRANRSLDQKQLVIFEKGYELYSTCEPCLACFDSALWAGIQKFVYCVDHHDFPDYFHDHPYNIENYELDNPGEITTIKHLQHEDGVKLFRDAKKKYGW